jgi:biotin operon repressor
MSVRLMSAVFESESLSPTERLIMLALADHADDDGRCYPSIERLCRRTGLSERAVQTNIKRLSEGGYVKVHVGGGKGHANLYFISANPAADAPRSKCTPAADAPQTPQQVRQTPQQVHPNHQEPPLEPSESNSAGEICAALSEWASTSAVRSFVAYRRKQKGKALSLTAAKRQATQLKAIFDAGGDPDDALGMAEERGWQSVQASWYFKAKAEQNEPRTHHRNGTASGRPHRPDPALEQIARLAGLGQASGNGGA